MDTYIQIALLNDFIFCPKSIYFHRLYEHFADVHYKDVPQKVGALKHETVEKGTYSTRKSVLQGMPVFSEKYNLGGKIDTFDIKTGELVERKTKIRKIYDGYRFQLYAQYFCLAELGYEVRKLFFHSLIDNKRYPIEFPGPKAIEEFENVLFQIRNFQIEHSSFKHNVEKCKMCIYSNLCDSCPFNN